MRRCIHWKSADRETLLAEMEAIPAGAKLLSVQVVQVTLEAG